MYHRQNIGTDLCYFSASQLLENYENKTVSPVEVTKAIFDKIKKVDGAVNAFSFLNEDLAHKTAKLSENRWGRGSPIGLLDGIPATVKDLIPSKDWEMRRGSKTNIMAGSSGIDGPAVARLRENNAIFIGRTTTPEFGWKGVTDSPLTGITRNPWDFSKTAGGSSGGAVVAAALGMGVLNIGTDGGGSIRIPASFSGVFGFKGTAGRVPGYPASILGSMSHIGPITRSVNDAALLMNVIAKPDIRDWFSLPYDNCDYLQNIAFQPNNLRMAFSPTLGFVEVDPEVEKLVRSGVKVFENMGAFVEEVDPQIDCPLDCFNIHWHTAFHRFVMSFSEEERKLLDPDLYDLANNAVSITLGEYQEAMDQRIALGNMMNLFHDQYDLLLTPTLPISAFEAGRLVADPKKQRQWPDWTPFSYPFNLTGQPACSVPCGFTKAGLPVGLQIVGPRYKDLRVMQAAELFSREKPFQMPKDS